MSTPPPALSTSSRDLPELRLKPREDRRIAGGHLWIFSNEVDTVRTPLTAFATGAHCRVVASNDRFLGYAYVNPHALICARILGRDPEFAPGKSLLVHRLKVALALREKLYSQPFYRLVYGESDSLPGLVLDRFGDVVVGQQGHCFLPLYEFDPATGMWTHREFQERHERFSIEAALESNGCEQAALPTAERVRLYAECLQEAREMAARLGEPGAGSCSKAFEFGELQFFNL